MARWLGVVAVAALLAACSGERRPEGPSTGRSGSVAAKPAFEQKDASSVVHISVTEFKVVAPTGPVKGPKVYFVVKNTSTAGLDHDLVITKPGQTDEEPAIAEVEDIPPGDQRSLAVELKPGRYQLACFIKTTNSVGSVIDHYQRGTHADIEVTG